MFVDWFDTGVAGSGGVGRARVPSMWHEMNALLGALERPAQAATPQLSVQTDESTLTLSLTAPGVRADDIDVSVTGRRLDVSVVREPKPPEGFRTIRQERRAWRLDRTFELPFDVVAEEAEASLDNGVFTLTLPRVPKSEPVKIPVHTGRMQARTVEASVVDAIPDTQTETETETETPAQEV